VKPEAVLGRLVRACIEARDHPVIEERDAAVEGVALVLEQIVRERLAEDWDWDARHLSLDGLQTLSVEVEGETRLHIVGAFYLLHGRGHRMLPMEAAFSLDPGAVSTVKVAGAESVFEMPQSERQLVRGVRSAVWRHALRLHLAGDST
jgi:hypothetical protein